MEEIRLFNERGQHVLTIYALDHNERDIEGNPIDYSIHTPNGDVVYSGILSGAIELIAIFFQRTSLYTKDQKNLKEKKS